MSNQEDYLTLETTISSVPAETACAPEIPFKLFDKKSDTARCLSIVKMQSIRSETAENMSAASTPERLKGNFSEFIRF